MIKPTDERCERMLREMIEWDPQTRLMMALRLGYSVLLSCDSNLLDAQGQEKHVYLVIGRGRGADVLRESATELRGRLSGKLTSHRGASGDTPLRVKDQSN